MWRCPVCEKEQIQGFVCDNCGFDPSCNYEQNRTLCSPVPRYAEPISVRAERWRQEQAGTSAPGALVCPKCGGTRFSILTDTMKFVCADCGANMPIPLPPGTDEEEPPPSAAPEEPLPPTAPEEPLTPPAPENPRPPAAPRTKKRGFKAAAVIFALLVLVALSQRDQLRQANAGTPSGSQTSSRRYIDYTPGTVEGTTYINEWADLKLDIPEGWDINKNIYDPEYNTIVFDYGLSVSGENEQGTHLKCDIWFEALKDEFISLPEEAYLDDKMNFFENIGFQTDRQYEEIQVGGMIFKSVHYYRNFGDDEAESWAISEYVHKFGDRLCTIKVFNFGESQEEQHDQFVSKFTEYDRYEGMFFDMTDENGNYRPYVDTSEQVYGWFENIKQKFAELGGM